VAVPAAVAVAELPHISDVATMRAFLNHSGVTLVGSDAHARWLRSTGAAALPVMKALKDQGFYAWPDERPTRHIACQG
jgi:hypothetical protein